MTQRESDGIRLALAGNYQGFDVRIRELQHTWSSSGLKLTGRCFYLSLRDGKPTLDEFVDYMFNRLIPYCVPRAEREEAERKFAETGDYTHILSVQAKARELFIRSRKRRTTGEPGELVLFILLEAALKAPQLVCKMSLKTNENMPVHGADGIHVQWSQDGDIVLVWGESKLYKKLPQALSSIVSSVSDFASSRAPTKRKRELDIVRDHANIPPGKARDMLLEYLDVYSEKSNQLTEIHACLAGYDSDVYSALSGKGAEEVLRDRYLSRVEAKLSGFAKKVGASNIRELTLCLMLLPFPSVEDLQARFLARVEKG